MNFKPKHTACFCTTLSLMTLSRDASAQVSPTPTPTPPGKKIKSLSPTSTAIHYDVKISSDIEPSYRKVEVPLPPALNPLPDSCYLRDSNGNFITDANGKRSLDIGPDRPVLWADPIRGVYSVRCRRVNGSMSVESAVEWRGYWHARANFTASPLGYTDPSYKWSFSGGTPSPEGAIVIGRDESRLTLGTAMAYIILPGAEEDALTITKSTASVNVLETTPALPANLMSSSYDINWHLPEENFVEDSKLRRESYIETPLEPALNSLVGSTPKYVGPNETVEAMALPEPFVFRRAGTTTTVVAGSVGAVSVLYGAALPAHPFLKGSLAAIGITATLVTQGSPQAKPVTMKNDYARWKQSVQDTINGKGAYVYPAGLAQTVSLQSPGNENLDTIWQSCGMKIVRRQKYTDHFGVMDYYNSHGYVRTEDFAVSKPGIFEDMGEYLQNWQQTDP